MHNNINNKRRQYAILHCDGRVDILRKSEDPFKYLRDSIHNFNICFDDSAHFAVFVTSTATLFEAIRNDVWTGVANSNRTAKSGRREANCEESQSIV